MRTKRLLVISLMLAVLSVSLASCTKECDCDCCDQSGTQTGNGDSQSQHQIVGKWLCTSSTYSTAGQTFNNTIKGYVAEFGADGIASIPGDANATTYTISGNTITLGTGTHINVTELSATTLKYNFTKSSSGSSYSYTCSFSRL